MFLDSPKYNCKLYYKKSYNVDCEIWMFGSSENYSPKLSINITGANFTLK